MTPKSCKYVGPGEVILPGTGLVKHGDTVEFSTDAASRLHPDLWAVGTTKKAAKKATVDTPVKGEEETS